MKRIFLAILGAIMIGVGSLTMVQPTYAAECATTNKFLGFKAWYEGLPCSGTDIQAPAKGDESALKNFVMTIVGNVTYDISMAIGWGALAMVIWGGFQFIMSQGDVNRTMKAKKTLTAAATGLVIALSASVLINTAQGVLGITDGSLAGTGDYTGTTQLKQIFDYAYEMGAVIAVIFLIKNGFNYMVANGDPGKAQGAIRGVLFSAIGLGVVISAWTLTAFIVEKVGAAAAGAGTGAGAVQAEIKAILPLVLGILEIIAVIVVIVGGYTIMTARGEPSKVTQGRNAIIGGLVGMIIALLSFAIAQAVIDAVYKGDITSRREEPMVAVVDGRDARLLENVKSAGH